MKADGITAEKIKEKNTKKLRIALAGNPNSGKTTIFNALTGSRQHVGNWPGVTVEKKEGKFKYDKLEVDVVDLPGTYSLTAYSLDERIARDFLVKEKNDSVVTVIDASNLERNLYIVAQLLELGLNVIVDLNMMDIVERKKVSIDIQKMEKILGIKIIKTVGNKGKGIDKLKNEIIATNGKKKVSFKIDYGDDIEKEIKNISNFIDGKIPNIYPTRWFAIKLLEGDLEIINIAKSLADGEIIEKEVLESTQKLEKHLGYDSETAIVERRYAFLEGLVKECVLKEPTLKERVDISDRIDKVLTNKFLGIPIFFGLMWLLFQFVFKVGEPISGWIDDLFGWISEISTIGLEKIAAPLWLTSFISEGVIAGVGSVLVFLPYIVLLYFAIAILEDSGYMSRAAFVMDRIMHTLGLHGKSFIPMILGFGCNIPAIMATRTLESRKDRILTIMVVPLMSCAARLPIYTLFAAAFFPRHQGLVVFSLYLLGIVLAIAVARLFKSLFFSHEVAPLIMELPPYRLPSIKGISVHTWQRSKLFLKKAGTIIFAAVVLIWILASLPWGVDYASESSFIGKVGSSISPVFKPAGFGFWQAGVALIFGIIAKEVVVGAFGTLYGVGEEGLLAILQTQFNVFSAYAFMAISLIYVPCIAAIGAIYRETNLRWTALAVGYSLILGWVVATIIYQVGKFFI
jgi:ferrous iron transport protein B